LETSVKYLQKCVEAAQKSDDLVLAHLSKEDNIWYWRNKLGAWLMCHDVERAIKHYEEMLEDREVPMSDEYRLFTRFSLANSYLLFANPRYYAKAERFY
jgi:hypothetical protein